MSYYGNGRLIYHTEHYNFPNHSPLTTQTQLAEKYYKRAMERSPDREVQAKACFMAAKTEQNRYFANQHSKNQPVSDPQAATHSPVYFKLLKTDTPTPSTIRKSCASAAYFRFYIKR